MLPEQIRSLPTGTLLYWVVGEGQNEVRHRAKLVDRTQNQVGLLVYFTDRLQQKKRWSLITNKPVGQGRGHVGKIRLELAKRTTLDEE